MKKRLLTITAAAAFTFLSSNIHAEEITYSAHIKPLWEKQCSACHGAKSPEGAEFDKDKDKYKAKMKGPKMDSYTSLTSFIIWPDTGAIMRRLDDGKNTKDVNPGNMHRYLGGTDEERAKNLALFKEWIGNWNLKKWPEVTKEELDKVKVKY